MISLFVLFIIFSAIYLVCGILGVVLRLSFGILKWSFGIAVAIGAFVLRFLFAAPLLYAIIWAAIIYLIIRGIGAVVNKK